MSKIRNIAITLNLILIHLLTGKCVTRNLKGSRRYRKWTCISRSQNKNEYFLHDYVALNMKNNWEPYKLKYIA